MHYMWLWLGSTLIILPITVIIQHYRCIIMHYKYVHNASQMDALSEIIPKSQLTAKVKLDMHTFWLVRKKKNIWQVCFFFPYKLILDTSTLSTSIWDFKTSLEFFRGRWQGAKHFVVIFYFSCLIITQFVFGTESGSLWMRVKRG